MTAATAAPPAHTDDEIREWARATGRKIGERGRISAALRGEYAGLVAELAGDPPPAAAATGPEPAARGAESHAEPAPARAEQRPRKVPAARRGRPGPRLAAFLGLGPAPKTRGGKKPADERPRESIARTFASGWDRFGQWVANVNPPVGRALSWQADYAGMVAEELLPNTPVDRVLQYAVRAKGRLGAAGAVVATPILVGMLQAPGNQPDGPAGMAKHKVLMTGLEDCIRLQLKYLGGEGRADKLAEQVAARQAEQAEVDAVLNLFFAQPVTPEEAAAAAAAEQEQHARAAAAAAVARMAPAPGFVVPPDVRGQAPPQRPAGPASVRMKIGPDGILVPE